MGRNGLKRRPKRKDGWLGMRWWWYRQERWQTAGGRPRALWETNLRRDLKRLRRGMNNWVACWREWGTRCEWLLRSLEDVWGMWSQWMYGLLRCKEGNNVCNFPYSFPMSWLHSQFIGVVGLKGIIYLSVSELSSLMYYDTSCRGESPSLKAQETLGTTTKYITHGPHRPLLCCTKRRCQQNQEKIKGHGRWFSTLAHYIGRLGATRSSADTIVRAVIEVPALRKISDVRTVKAPEPREVTINQEYMSPYGAWWMEWYTAMFTSST